METSPELKWLLGKSCTQAQEHAPGCFTFDFGNGHLVVECAWRIIVGDRLTAAGRDHGQMFGLKSPFDACASAMGTIGNRRVTAAEFHPTLGDLTIEFEGGSRLELINDSSGYEAWSLRDPNGYTLFTANGGEVSGYAA